jgi:hypothetical protein
MKMRGLCYFREIETDHFLNGQPTELRWAAAAAVVAGRTGTGHSRKSRGP